MLRYSRESSADILKGFECGIQAMDDFIHGSLASFLEKDPRYSLYVAIDDCQGIVAMFITSPGIFVDHDGEFQDLPFGKPWGYFDDDFQMHAGTMYPTLEIDYLAVRKDLRERGIGSEIIDNLLRKTRLFCIARVLRRIRNPQNGETGVGDALILRKIWMEISLTRNYLTH